MSGSGARYRSTTLAPEDRASREMYYNQPVPPYATRKEPSYPDYGNRTTYQESYPSRDNDESSDSDSECNIVGLYNLGNTCFVNCVLQCLIHTRPLWKYFNNKDNDEYNKRSTYQGNVARAFASFCQLVAKAEPKASIMPQELRRVALRLASQYAGYRQHDAQEFLRYLLDGLNEDLNKVSRKPAYQELKDIPGESAFDAASRWQEYYNSRCSSVVTDLFGGQLLSEVTCDVCFEVSRACDVFLDLSLPLPVKDYQTSLSVEDCLKYFCKSEKLEREGYNCRKCRRRTNATRQIRIFRLPKVLVLHLKRFRTLSGLERAEKIQGSIDINTSDLTLRGCCSFAKDEQVRYKMFACVHHIGGCGSAGHYTASARTGGRWYNYSDTDVMERQMKPLYSSKSAYILFFIKRDSNAPSLPPSHRFVKHTPDPFGRRSNRDPLSRQNGKI
eukprot:Platyproteum_vivax@DN4095_c0_g1_i1.p1